MAPYIEYSLTSKTFGKQLETLYQKIRRLLSSRHVTISQKGCAGWEFIGYKKYVHGDNFKRIDWNVFQRWQEIVVREYSMETFRKWWIFWDKKITNANNTNFSDGELAWTSFNCILRRFTYDWIGFGYLNNPQREKKIHPTQKPVALYKWLLKNYAKPGDKIFDSHVGSGSIRIACHDMGFSFEGCEIDKDYWEAQEERYQQHAMQADLFTPESLFTGEIQQELL